MVLSQGSLSGHVRPTGWCARDAPKRDRQINAKAQTAASRKQESDRIKERHRRHHQLSVVGVQALAPRADDLFRRRHGVRLRGARGRCGQEQDEQTHDYDPHGARIRHAQRSVSPSSQRFRSCLLVAAKVPTSKANRAALHDEVETCHSESESGKC